MTFEFVISALACWRLCHLLRYESGPWDCLIELRECFGDSVVGKMLDCFGCLSVWLSLVWFAPLWLRILLALSALAMLLEVVYDVLWSRAEGPATGKSAGAVSRQTLDL